MMRTSRVTCTATTYRRLHFRGFSDSSEPSNYIYGTVKSYYRSKAYGFVVPDNGQEAIFVHRSSIRSTEKMPPMSPVTHPFLTRGERIRFVLEEVLGDKEEVRNKATQVEYEDGSQIPIYRENYVENVAKYEKSTLGEAVFEAYEATDTDEETRHAKVREAYEKAKQSIQAAQKRKDDINELVFNQ